MKGSPERIGGLGIWVMMMKMINVIIAVVASMRGPIGK